MSVREYPHQDGEFTVLGPETFLSEDALVIAHKGINYYAPMDTSDAYRPFEEES